MTDVTYKLGDRTLTFTGKDAGARLLAHEKVAEFLATAPPLKVDTNPQHRRIIWSYWEQGWTSAPAIVQSCAGRLRREAADFDVRMLDADSVRTAIQVDPTVAERTWQWKAHYSDVLRSYLLAEHGGIWIDATVLVTQPLDSLYRQIEPTPFFAYTVQDSLSSWFLMAQRGSIVPVALRDFFVWFWQNHDELPHYFWFHLVFHALQAHIPSFAAAWGSAVILSSPDAHALQRVQLQPLDEAQYSRILRTGHVQKMTYRFSGAPTAPKGSYLERVMKDFPPSAVRNSVRTKVWRVPARGLRKLARRVRR